MSRDRLQHKIRLYSIDNIYLMNSDQMTVQARLLSETVAAVVTWKLAFSSAFPFHVPPQVAPPRVSPSALLAGESKAHVTCRTKRKTLTSEYIVALERKSVQFSL